MHTNLPVTACFFVRKRDESLSGVHCWSDCSQLPVRTGVGLFTTRQLALVQVLSTAKLRDAEGYNTCPVTTRPFSAGASLVSGKEAQ